MPRPMTSVYELVEESAVTKSIDPHSQRLWTLPVGSLVEVLEEKPFVQVLHEGDDSQSRQLQEVKRMRVICRTHVHTFAHTEVLSSGWTSKTEHGML
eukprot:SAG25_NODE_11981_length_290_cov_1.041885_1_plen_96_part_11